MITISTVAATPRSAARAAEIAAHRVRTLGGTYADHYRAARLGH